MVICNNHSTCNARYLCGGAQPHERCDECGKCPFDKTADCSEIPIINDLKGNAKSTTTKGRSE